MANTSELNQIDFKPWFFGEPLSFFGFKSVPSDTSFSDAVDFSEDEIQWLANVFELSGWRTFGESREWLFSTEAEPKVKSKKADTKSQ